MGTEYKILIFGGTEEGRKIAELLDKKNISALVCVATEYGARILSESIDFLQGRLDEDGMSELIKTHNFRLCIDATHPYAVNVSRNIRAACEKAKLKMVRVVRENIDSGCGERFNTPEEIVEYLFNKDGNVFVSTGSKGLAAFKPIKERVYARVLPNAEVVAECNKMGFFGKRLICMQGPFSAELNAAMLRETNVKYLVTKESGAAGGFTEKLEAAREVGAVPLILRRPSQESGITLDEILRIIEELK
ncbi:MAG: precorrin-6A reductase [Oscillospiraceae bacterium]|nr:precorrin-6A reductase [Oscillospiraceae bacterium]